MNKKQREYLESLYKDCIYLARVKGLTEYGAGQGDLAAILLKKRRKNSFLKYVTK